MVTRQEIRDFTKWHVTTLFDIRNSVIPALRRGDIVSASATLKKRSSETVPPISLRDMAEANSDHLLDVATLGINAMTAHAVVGQLMETLEIHIKEIDYSLSIAVHPEVISAEVNQIISETDSIDFDDLERRLSRESTRLVGAAMKPPEVFGPYTERVWATICDVSEKTVENRIKDGIWKKHDSSSKGKIYFLRDGLPPNIDDLISEWERSKKPNP